MFEKFNSKDKKKKKFQDRKLFHVLLKTSLISLAGILLYYAAFYIHQIFLSSSTTLISVALLNDDLACPISRDNSCILDRRYFTNKASILDYTNSNCIAGEYKRWPKNTIGKTDGCNPVKCQLLHYKMEDIVKCLDMQDKRHRTLHITFIGDSLVRNQFINFIGLIPDYDRFTSLNHTKPNALISYHVDNNVTSKIFEEHIHVSFRWNAVINEELINDFRLWSVLEDSETPDLTFLGPTVHNMLKEVYRLSDRPFWEIVEEDLLPILLKYLNAHPQKKIIWIMQNPTIDLVGPVSSDPFNIMIHVKKIHNYNNKLRKIFKGTPVTIWDSLHPTIEENVRSCAIQRFQRGEAYAYNACGDFIHYGHRILSIGTQQIFNYICNHQKEE